jgi:hypothetical protein
MFNCVECKQSVFGCNVFVLICYCFLGEIRRYFLTAAHIAYSKQMFFLIVLQFIGPTSVFYRNSDLHMVQNTFPACWSSFINGCSAFIFSVKTHFLFGIFMGFLFPTVHTSYVHVFTMTKHHTNWIDCATRDSRNKFWEELICLLSLHCLKCHLH